MHVAPDEQRTEALGGVVSAQWLVVSHRAAQGAVQTPTHIMDS